MRCAPKKITVYNRKDLRERERRDSNLKEKWYNNQGAISKVTRLMNCVTKLILVENLGIIPSWSCYTPNKKLERGYWSEYSTDFFFIESWTIHWRNVITIWIINTNSGTKCTDHEALYPLNLAVARNNSIKIMGRTYPDLLNQNLFSHRILHDKWLKGILRRRLRLASWEKRSLIWDQGKGQSLQNLSNY